MQILIVLAALVTLTVAQYPPIPLTPTGTGTGSSAWNLLSNIYQQPGFNPFTLPQYGPFLRYGNMIVPNYFPTTTFGTPYNTYPVNNFPWTNTPFLGKYDSIPTIYQQQQQQQQSPMMNMIPYSPFDYDTVQSVSPFMNSFPANQYQQQFISNGIFGSPRSPIVYPATTNPLVDDSQQLIGATLTDFTPFSRKGLYQMLTRGVGKLDVYAKMILGRGTGLTRKLQEVCPEIDGGLSYVSCLTDSHSKTFECMKNIENHPMYLQCVSQPIVKKSMRDWFVNDVNWHKELTNCLSTTNYMDKINQPFLTNIRKPVESDITDELTDEIYKNTYDIEMAVNTRQCFYKLRKHINRCNELAVQCPKFKQCYEHPTIKLLQLRKYTMQSKFVGVMDQCLNGQILDSVNAINPNINNIPENFIPDFAF